MKRFDPTEYYAPSNPALRGIASTGTLAVWRSRGVGPSYVKVARRVYYRGDALNAFLDAGLVDTAA